MDDDIFGSRCLNETKSAGDVVQNKEQKRIGKLADGLYWNYIKHVGSFYHVVLVLLVLISGQIVYSGSDYFIVYWIRQEKSEMPDASDTFDSDLDRTIIYTYIAMTGLLLVLPVVAIFVFFGYIMNVSIALHDKMFVAVIQAPMNFFNTNPSGRILNRFTKDMGIIDDLIPKYLFECTYLGFVMIGTIVILSLTNLWLLLGALILTLLLFLLRLIYLPTSQCFKRLGGITRSPIYSHIGETIQGLATIRASKMEMLLLADFHKCLDVNSSVDQLYLDCSRAFGFYIDQVCVIYCTVVMLICNYQNANDAARVGLAITQVLSLTSMVQWLLRQWAELENQITSVERVLEYCDIEPEEVTDKIAPNKSWPTHGNISFVSASMKYVASNSYVLKQISFEIISKEKIGIVGRTGAGKSSLIWALLQLTPIQGTIFIDNVDISTIPILELRSKISIIPQQPLLFTGTLRKNLDLFDLYTDEDLWNALNEVQLKMVVSGLKLGLYEIILEGGSNFSMGQKQLICLARAIINKKRILILDEATANVDPLTDALIQNTIRNKFQDCTVLTIAHRLNSIMDSDRVLVMDEGAVAEFGHPFKLLQNTSGKFYSFVQQSGPGMAASLTRIAEISFKLKHQLAADEY